MARRKLTKEERREFRQLPAFKRMMLKVYILGGFFFVFLVVESLLLGRPWYDNPITPVGAIIYVAAIFLWSRSDQREQKKWLAKHRERNGDEPQNAAHPSAVNNEDSQHG